MQDNEVQVRRAKAASQLSHNIILKYQFQVLLENQMKAAAVRGGRDRLSDQKSAISQQIKNQNKSNYDMRVVSKGNQIGQHRKNIDKLEEKEM